MLYFILQKPVARVRSAFHKGKQSWFPEMSLAEIGRSLVPTEGYSRPNNS
jgi:hypothetical protein